MNRFKLYANVIPVQGLKRATLCDLQYGRIKLIPLDLYNLLLAYNGQAIDAILLAHAAEDRPVIEDYYQFLLEDEWGFLTDEPESFPDLDLTFDVPAAITNAIIDVDAGSTHDYKGLIDELDDLGCLVLQVRAYCALSAPQLEEVLQAAGRSKLRSLEIVTRFNPDTDESALVALANAHPRLYRLVLHGAPRDASVKTRSNDSPMGEIVYQEDLIEGPEACGVIDRGYFRSELSAFTESLRFNNCLNRKISVDRRGMIRNCPSLNQHFGNAGQVTLAQAAADPQFQELWHIGKDQVTGCRDCEFRYVCSDCRAYTVDGQANGKPAKCGYDPATATWQETQPMVLAV